MKSIIQHVHWKNGFLKGSGINYCECNLNFYRSIVYFYAIGTTVNNPNNHSFIKLVPTVKATSVSCSYKLKLELLKVSVTVCMEKSRKTVKSIVQKMKIQRMEIELNKVLIYSILHNNEIINHHYRMIYYGFHSLLYYYKLIKSCN